MVLIEISCFVVFTPKTKYIFLNQFKDIMIEFWVSNHHPADRELILSYLEAPEPIGSTWKCFDRHLSRKTLKIVRMTTYP